MGYDEDDVDDDILDEVNQKELAKMQKQNEEAEDFDMQKKMFAQ